MDTLVTPCVASVISDDGTRIKFSSVGSGPGLIIVGGVLSDGRDYLPLAHTLAEVFEVHLVDRRGRAGSGPQRESHSIDEECADLAGVARATGASAVFGHSFGGLVALEAARRGQITQSLFLYEPGVPLRGSLKLGWLEGYQRMLTRGDHRGAFAWMVKYNGFAPAPLRVAPLWFVRAALRIGVRGQRWATVEALLKENLIEHQILASLDAAQADRFSMIHTRTVLLGGSKSPAVLSCSVLAELARTIPDVTVEILPRVGHNAPIDKPSKVGSAISKHWHS
jgi:pimeloyl-ACP methyl ester carboxylesterase